MGSGHETFRTSHDLQLTMMTHEIWSSHSFFRVGLIAGSYLGVMWICDLVAFSFSFYCVSTHESQHGTFELHDQQPESAYEQTGIPYAGPPVCTLLEP